MTSKEEKRSFTPDEWTFLTKYFVGNNYRYRDNIIIPKNLGPIQIKSHEEKMIETFFESCFFKTFMSCVAGKYISLRIMIVLFKKISTLGYGLGAAIGLFSSSVGPSATDVEQQTARQVFKEMKTTTLSYAKNFALIGAVFSAVECTIESVRPHCTYDESVLNL